MQRLLVTFLCVTWLISVRDRNEWQKKILTAIELYETFLCITWLISICDATRFYAWQQQMAKINLDSHRVVWDMTQLYVWHDSFLYATRLVSMRDRNSWPKWILTAMASSILKNLKIGFTQIMLIPKKEVVYTFCVCVCVHECPWCNVCVCVCDTVYFPKEPFKTGPFCKWAVQTTIACKWALQTRLWCIRTFFLLHSNQTW